MADFPHTRALRLRPALRTFLDTSSLAASPGLWSQLKHSLDDSDNLVVLLSSSAAASEWVEREVRYWLDSGRGSDHVLLVHVEGELDWDDDEGDFSTSCTCVVPSLRGAYPEEPAWVDLRWATASGSPPDPKDPRMRSASGDLAAALLGRSKDELIGADVAARRRGVRLLVATVIVLAVLLVGTVAASVTAVRQRDRAVEQASVSLSRQLAADSRVAIDRALDEATLLALQAHAVEPTADGVAAVLATLQAEPRLDKVLMASSTPQWQHYQGFDPISRRALLVEDRGLRLVPVGGTSRELVIDIGGAVAEQRSVSVSADGRQVALTEAGGRIRTWDARTGARRGDTVVDQSDPEEALTPSWSADGRWLALSGHGGTLVLTASTLRRVAGPLIVADEFGTGSVSSVVFDPSGRWMIMEGDEWTLWSTDGWGLEQDEPLGERGGVSASFSPDGRRLALVDNFGAELLDTGTWRPTGVTVPGSLNVYDAAWSPDGSQLALAGDDGVLLADAGTGELVTPPMTTHPGLDRADVASRLYFVDDGELVVRSDDGLLLWRPYQTDRLVTVRAAGGEPVTGLRFMPDGDLLVSGGTALRRVSPEGVEVVASTAGVVPVSDLVLSPGADRVAFADDDGARVVSLTADDRSTGPLRMPTYGPYSVDLHEDGTVLAGAGDAAIALWDTRNGRRLRPLSLAGSSVGDYATEVRFLSGPHLLAAGGTGVARWDVVTGERTDLAEPGQVGALDYSAAAGLLAVSVPRAVHLVDPGSSSTVATIPAPDAAAALAFSPDGTRLAAASPADVVVWDVASRRQLGRFDLGTAVQSEGAVTAVAWDARGRRLAAAAGTPRVAVWELDPSLWRDRACQLAGRELTTTEWRDRVGAGVRLVPVCS